MCFLHLEGTAGWKGYETTGYVSGNECLKMKDHSCGVGGLWSSKGMDILQGCVVIGESIMALNWKRGDLD